MSILALGGGLRGTNFEQGAMWEYHKFQLWAGDYCGTRRAVDLNFRRGTMGEYGVPYTSILALGGG